MEVLEANCMPISSILGREGDTNYMHENAVENLNQGSELDKPIENVVNEEHITKKVHQFYFVKFWPYEDPNVKSKIEVSEKLIKKMNQHHFQIIEKLEERMHDRGYSISFLKHLEDRDRSFRKMVTKKTKILHHLQEALDKLDFAKTACQKRATNSCSSREFNSHVSGTIEMIQSLNSRMLHGSKSLATERKLLREISASQQKEAEASWLPKSQYCSPVLEFHCFIQWFYNCMECWRWCRQCNYRTRDEHLLEEIKMLIWPMNKEFVNTARRRNKKSSLSSKKDIQDRVRLINRVSEELRKEHMAVKTTIMRVKKHLEPVENDLSSLQKKLVDVHQRKDEAYQRILRLRKQHEEENSCYYEYLWLLNNARELAVKKDVAALEELSKREVEMFMSQWNNSKAFRNGYEKMILPSLDSCQLSKDGRMRNPDDEPLILKTTPHIKPVT